MPELPEVETIKSDLVHNLVGKKITGVDFLWPGILKDEDTEVFKKKVIGRKIIGVKRRAKNIDLELYGRLFLLFHMKMTGHLIYTDKRYKVTRNGKWIVKPDGKNPLADPINQYIRVVFSLSGGKILAFSDLRKFAYLKLVESDELKETYSKYGPEPLEKDFNPEILKRILSGKKTPIKKLLMDQKQIAGIGNIYADEILYASCIHPLERAGDIKSEKVILLYNSIIKILTEAIKYRGTSTSDYRDLSGKKGGYGDILKVYRRTGLPCRKDETKIERIMIGGRSSHFCPECQKPGEKK